MKNDNINTLERGDLRISEDIEVDTKNSGIRAYFEAWFDVDKKFGLNTRTRPDEWVNVSGLYNPFDKKTVIDYCVHRLDSEENLIYYPTDEENAMIAELISEACKNQTNNMTCGEYYMLTYSEYYMDACELVFEKKDDYFQVRNNADNFILFKSTDKDMERFVGKNVEFVYYGNKDCYGLECSDTCEVIYCTDVERISEEDEEMEM